MAAATKRTREAEDEETAREIRNKRLRPTETFEFYVRFTQTSTLKSWLESLGSVLEEVCFQVHADEDFSGFFVESLDSANVSLAQGKIDATVELSGDENPVFHLKLQNLLGCLKNVHPQHFFDIWRLKGDADVQIAAFEPHVNTYIPKSRLKTLYKDAEFVQLKGMVYSLYVDIDLTCFRNSIRTAREHKAEALEIEVRVPRKAAPEETTKKVTTFFIMKYESLEVSSSFVYQSSSETNTRKEEPDGSSSLVIRASDVSSGEYEDAPPDDDTDCLFSGSYSVEYLQKFVKQMDRPTVTLRLAKGMPLLIEYPLGPGPTTYVRFLLAERESG